MILPRTGEQVLRVLVGEPESSRDVGRVRSRHTDDDCKRAAVAISMTTSPPREREGLRWGQPRGEISRQAHEALSLLTVAAETILPVRLRGAHHERSIHNHPVVQGASCHPRGDSPTSGARSGTQFVVLGEKDVVIFKILQPPAKRDFAALAQQARQAAKRTGMRRADLTTAVSKTRRARRAK